jgi:hypothetical protein
MLGAVRSLYFYMAELCALTEVPECRVIRSNWLTTFLLTPFYLVAVPLMLLAVVCDFAIFRVSAHLGPRVAPKGLWEF